MDGITSFAGTFSMFLVQWTICVLCFTKIRELSNRTLSSFFVENTVPVLLPSPPFFKCNLIGMVFRCKCVVLSDLFFCAIFPESSRMDRSLEVWSFLTYHVLCGALFDALFDNAWDPGEWFFFITYPGNDNMSNLSLLNCRLFSEGCMHFPHVQYTIPVSQYKAQSGHCLFEEVS